MNFILLSPVSSLRNYTFTHIFPSFLYPLPPSDFLCHCTNYQYLNIVFNFTHLLNFNLI